jgi:hypothetical protein
MPRRGQYKNKMNVDLGTLFSALGSAGVAANPMPTMPDDGPSPSSVGLYGPPTAAQATYDTRLADVKANPYIAKNAFAKPEVAQRNAEYQVNQRMMDEAAARELELFDKMTPRVLDRMKQQGLITNEQQLDFEKRLRSPEIYNAEAEGIKIKGKAANEIEALRLREAEKIKLEAALESIPLEMKQAAIQVAKQNNIVPTPEWIMQYINVVNPSQLKALQVGADKEAIIGAHDIARSARLDDYEVALHPQLKSFTR